MSKHTPGPWHYRRLDECGERGCCGVASYKPHADDCWVTTARAAIAKAEEKT